MFTKPTFLDCLHLKKSQSTYNFGIIFAENLAYMRLKLVYWVGLVGLLLVYAACSSGKKYALLQSDYYTLQKKYESISTISSKSDSLQTDLNDCRLQLSKTEDVLTELYLKFEGKEYQTNYPIRQVNVSKCDSLRSLNIELNQNLQNQYNITRNLQDENQKLKILSQNSLAQNNVELVNLQAKYSFNENQLKEKESEVNKLKQNNSDLQSKVFTLQETLDNTIQDRKSNKSNDQVENDLAELKSSNNQLKEEINKRELTIQDLNRQLNQISKESETKTSKKVNSKEVEQLKRENSKLQTESEEISNKIKSLDIELNTLKNLLAEKDNKLTEQKEKASSYETEISKLNNQLEIEQKKFNTLQAKLAENPKSKSKELQEKENEIQALRTQLSSAQQSQTQLKNEENTLRNNLEKERIQNQELTAQISSQNNTLKNKLNEDSLKNEIQSLIIQNQRTQSELSQSRQKIESLNTTQNNSVQQNLKLETLQKILTEKENEIKLLKDKNTEVTKSEPKNQTPKSTIPNELLEKLESLPQKYPKAGLFYRISESAASIFVPQSFLFEGETVALREPGSTFLTELISILPKSQPLDIDIVGYGSSDSNASKTLDGSYRRANTINKLMMVSGISPTQVTIGARPFGQFNNRQGITPAGIEIALSPR